MHLIELYKSVQGESSFAGLPCIFVRLAGCNLRCAWCDSEYTFTGGKPFTTLNPSAENLARYFYEKTKLQLDEMTKGRVTVKDCTLYETDTSFARYYE